jgi:hypothetical protein
MPNENEKSNFQLNNERLIEIIREIDYTDAYKDGTTVDEWQKHPELFTDGYPENEDDEDDDDEDYDEDEDEDDVEVNKDSRFLK